MTFSRSASIPRLLQQQPQRCSDRQQQQSSGAGEFQPKTRAQMGEGSQEGIRDYHRSSRAQAEDRQPGTASKAADERAAARALTPRDALNRKPGEQAQ